MASFTGKGPRKGWRTPLNGIKYSEQRDEETGYGYFGARYMDHEQMTMWLSVNPMADKYPGISPYAYCVWNPVKLVDPDGEFPAPIHAVMVFKACMKTEKQLRAAVFLH